MSKSTETAPAPKTVYDANTLYRELTTRLDKMPPEYGQAVAVFIRKKSGHATLPSYHANGASENDKTETYRDCIKAVLLKRLDLIKVEEPEESIPVETVVDKEPETVEDVCQGRTIWNSDGKSGPALICPPPPVVETPHATCTHTVAKAFGFDKLPASLVTVMPDPPATEPTMPRRQEFDSIESLVRTLVTNLQGLVTKPDQPTMDDKKIQEIVENQVKVALDGLYKDIHSVVEQETLNAKFQLLGVMVKAYQKHKEKLADAIAEA